MSQREENVYSTYTERKEEKGERQKEGDEKGDKNILRKEGRGGRQKEAESERERSLCTTII